MVTYRRKRQAGPPTARDTRPRPKQVVTEGKMFSFSMTIDDVTELWRCHRVTVLRLIERGQLHPIELDDETMRFDRAEVLSLANCRIARYPHLSIASRPK